MTEEQDKLTHDVADAQAKAMLLQVGEILKSDDICQSCFMEHLISSLLATWFNGVSAGVPERLAIVNLVFAKAAHGADNPEQYDISKMKGH